MKVSKGNDKLKKKTTTTAVTPPLKKVLTVVSTHLSLKTQNTHTMVEWCMKTMVFPIFNEAPQTLNKGMGNTSP